MILSSHSSQFIVRMSHYGDHDSGHCLCQQFTVDSVPSPYSIHGTQHQELMVSGIWVESFNRPRIYNMKKSFSFTQILGQDLLEFMNVIH